MNSPPYQPRFVSRGGLKLAAALDAFALDVTGFTCADLGCNVGGFTDCLLQRGAAKVHAVDTGYGALAWKLRNDPRVVVMERTNAMHAEPPVERVDLVVADLAWTPQKHAIPAALRWRPRWIVTLIKPHYELAARNPAGRGGNTPAVLDDAQAQQIAEEVFAGATAWGVEPLKITPSPIRGGQGKGARGNTEYLALLRPSASVAH